MRKALGVTVLAALALATSAPAATVGTSFPAGFPTIDDASLGVPVIGFGAAGPVERTPVIFLHGNNDTPFPTVCNPFGTIHNFAQYFADNGYALPELWGLRSPRSGASTPRARSAASWAHTTRRSSRG